MMKKIITLASTLLVSALLPAFALAETPVQASAEALIADCNKQADAQQPQDRDAFVNECLNDKVGYEKDKED